MQTTILARCHFKIPKDVNQSKIVYRIEILVNTSIYKKFNSTMYIYYCLSLQIDFNLKGFLDIEIKSTDLYICFSSEIYEFILNLSITSFSYPHFISA